MSRPLASFQKNNSEDIRLEIVKLRGKSFLDVRIYTSLIDGSDKVPTGKGFSLSPANWAELKKAFDDIQPTLKTEGFLE